LAEQEERLPRFEPGLVANILNVNPEIVRRMYTLNKWGYFALLY